MASGGRLRCELVHLVASVGCQCGSYNPQETDALQLLNKLYMQQKNLRLYEYHFELHVRYCQITMRFPCTFSLHWKLGNSYNHADKNAVNENNRVAPINNQVDFNTTLKLTGQMLWNSDARQFLEKKVVTALTQSLLTVNLSSQSKPDEIKMAGVVNIELARFLNESEFADVDMLYPLERCPDKSSQICVAVGFRKGRELRMDELQDATSVSKIAPELSSIGKAHSIQSSEYLDLKDLQLRVPETAEELEDEHDSNKRIKSLNRTSPRKPATKVPRVSMQPLITEEKEVPDEPESFLRKARSNELLPNIQITTPAKHENSRTPTHAQRASPNYLSAPNQKPAAPTTFENEIMESLKQINDNLERENDQLKEENTSLKRLNQDNSAELQELHRKMEQLAKNDLAARKENELIFLDYNREIDRLKKDLSSKDARMVEMTARLNEKEVAGTAKTTSELRELRQKNKSLEQEVQTLQQTIDEYNVRLADHTTLANNYYAIEAECNRLQQEFDHSEQQIWDLTLNAKEKDKTMTQLQKTVNQLTQNRKSLESDVACLEEENNQLKEHIDSLERELQTEKDNFNEEFQALREMITTSMSNEDETLDTIRNLEEECMRMSEILITRADHIAYFENRLNELEREVSELNMIRQTTQSILEHSITEQQSLRQIEQLQLCVERTSEQQSEKCLPAPGALDFSRPVVQNIKPRHSERGHKYSNTSWALKEADTINIKPEENEVNRLNVIIDVLKLRNQQLTDSVAALKEKQDKSDQQPDKKRVSDLSKKNTELTKESESEDLSKSVSELITRLKNSQQLMKEFTGMVKAELPTKQSDSETAIYSHKVEVINKIRQVSVDLQKFKLGMMKTARGTTQLQQVITNIKPLQNGIFQLLSLDRGIIGGSPWKC